VASLRFYNFLAPVNRALWQRQPRERVLLAVVVLAVLAALWYYQLFQPQQQAIQQAAAEIERVEAEIPGLRVERDELTEELESDPEEAIRERIAELEAELERLRTGLSAEIPDFIDPGRMRKVLRALLTERDGVRVVAFERLPAELLIASGGAQSAETDGGNGQDAEPDGSNGQSADAEGAAGAEEGLEIYRHPVRLELEADYPSTVRFLEAVEGRPWELAWEELDYEVTEHPQAQIQIRFYTISSHEAWLGL